MAEQTREGGEGSRTVTASSSSSGTPLVLTLKPKGKPKKGVRWTNDTIDNSMMNKKSSKGMICYFHMCIGLDSGGVGMGQRRL